MVLCIRCFTREQQVLLTGKKAIKKDHKHPKNVKIITCSRCIQKVMEKPEDKKVEEPKNEGE